MKNDYDLNKHKKSDKIKWIAVFLCVILLAVTVTAAITQGFKNWNPYGWLDKKQEQNEPQGVIDGNGNQMETGTVYEIPAKMSFSAAALSAAGEQGVTITLQATVLPVDAQNKAVDWVVEWNVAETNGESPVTDFITVTPQADGSNIANVTCYKAFPGDTIIVRVITRDGGFSASCIISFVGHPSSLSIIPTGAEVKTDSGWNVPIVDVYSGKEYGFDLQFDNIYHSVDSNFVPNFTCEIVGVGQIKLLYEKTDRNGKVTESKTSAFDVSGTIPFLGTNSNGTANGEIINSSIMPYYFSASVINNKLTINVKQSIAAFYASRSPRYFGERYTFDSYVDANRKPYFQIRVTETNTGLSQTVNIRMESNVSSVALNNSELTF